MHISQEEKYDSRLSSLALIFLVEQDITMIFFNIFIATIHPKFIVVRKLLNLIGITLVKRPPVVYLNTDSLSLKVSLSSRCLPIKHGLHMSPTVERLATCR